MLNFPDTHFRHFRNDPRNSNSLPRDVILSLAGDEKGNLWIGTENGGLSIFNPETETFMNYLHDDLDNSSLSNNSIYSLYKDPHNNMWIGTYSGGVDLYSKDANQFPLYKHSSSSNSPGNNNILDFLEDSRGIIWIGTDGGGVERFDPKTEQFTHFSHDPGNPQSICGNYVISVREDKDKNIWMGTCGDGISVYNSIKKTFRQIKSDPENDKSISGNNNGAMTVDKDKDLWVTSWGDGLNLYQPKTETFVHYRHDSSNINTVSADRIIYLFADSKGLIWIGTFDKGLDLFDKRTKTFTHFVHDSSSNSLSDNSIHCIYEDRKGNIWIATKSGLNCLDRRSHHFTHYFARDGLPDALISAILEDHKGNLWISTNNGLSKYDPRTGTFKNFSTADGLQSNEFKAHAALKSADGALYFGGVNGFNRFFPDSIKANSFAPPLVITSFQIFNKEVPISGEPKEKSPLQKDITETREIIISYKQSVISFGFASLNYTIPEKKQYEYKLEGFDKKWNNTGINHSATYTNLDPGEYIFQVKGLNNDGSWSPDITSLRLTVTPPFWKTQWFRILAIVLLVGTAIAFYRFRVYAVEKQKKALEQRVEELDKAVAQGKFEIASDVLHDIGNALVGFGSYLTRISRSQAPEQQENLEKLAVFFEAQQPAMVAAIGEARSGAVIKMLKGIAQTQKATQEETARSVTEQFNIINHIQEILHIQRQYITGQESQERKPVNIRNLIKDCLAMLNSSIDKNAVTVTQDIPADIPPIKGDRTRLMQVFLQVFRNSMEAFAPEALEKTIFIQVSRKSGELVLEIRDNGRGFDNADAAKFFERGFSTKVNGAGMGLYNSHDIMESHEGAITLTSEGPGKGAQAMIRLKI
jgi:ligand-binding sensor domain-containing protein/signal transduction histidine kinase